MRRLRPVVIREMRRLSRRQRKSNMPQITCDDALIGICRRDIRGEIRTLLGRIGGGSVVDLLCIDLDLCDSAR